MEISGRQFGLLIAYLLPGFVGMAGLAPLAPAVATWLQADSLGTAGVSPSLYVLLAATAFGLVLSGFRWLLIDPLLHRTGISRPTWKDQELPQRLEAFDYLVENHYRYYQFYANTVVALMWAYPVHRLMKTSPLLGLGTDLGVIVICAVLLAGARDTLAKYYTRTSRLIGHVAEKGLPGDVMTNGNHIAEVAGQEPAPTPTTQPKLNAKPKTEQPGKGKANNPK